MNTIKKSIFALIIITLAIAGCVKEVNVDVNEVNFPIAAKCLFHPENYFKAYISHVVPLSDYNQSKISNAIIILKEGNYIVDTFLVKTPGVYISERVPEIGKEYSLSIEVPGYKPIISKLAVAPEKALIKNCIITDTSAIDEGDILSEAIIEFQDNDNTSDFYEIRIIHYCSDSESGDTILYRAYFRDLGNDAVLVNEGLLQYYPETILFSDALFNGNIARLKINFLYRPCNTMILLNHISSDYYQYIRSLTLYNNSVESSLWGSSEPVNVFSNIDGGFGIFAGFSSDSSLITGDDKN